MFKAIRRFINADVIEACELEIERIQEQLLVMNKDLREAIEDGDTDLAFAISKYIVSYQFKLGETKMELDELMD